MKFYFDMDGVLADWVAGFEKLFKGEIEYADFNDAPKEEYDRIKNVISSNPKFYYDLPVMKHAVNALKDLVKNGYEVAILTSCGKDNTRAVAAKKARWIEEVFSGYDIPFYYVTTSKEKAAYANADAVLIDDRPKSTKPFKAAGGNVVLYKDGVTNLNRELKKYL